MANDLPRSCVGWPNLAGPHTRWCKNPWVMSLHQWKLINWSFHSALHLHVFTCYLSISKTCFFASLFPMFSEGCESISERQFGSACETCHICPYCLVFIFKQLQQVCERLLPSKLHRCFFIMCLFMCLLIVSILFLFQSGHLGVTNFILLILILTTLKHFH